MQGNHFININLIYMYIKNNNPTSCYIYLLNENISLGHLGDRGERILHNAHDWSVRLRRENVPGHHQHLLNLRLSLQALRHMQVHLISVKVSIVGRGHREVESKSRPRQDLHTVTHHGHFVERGLTIENNKVIVHQMAFHFEAILQVEVRGTGMVAQVHTLSSISDDVLGTGILVVTTPYQLYHSVGSGLEDGEDEKCIVLICLITQRE